MGAAHPYRRRFRCLNRRRAWEAFNSVKGACVNLTALDVFRRAARPTPDVLAIAVGVHLRFLGRVIELT